MSSSSHPSRRDVRRPTPRRRNVQSQTNSDFVDFLHRLLDILFTPITYPLRVIRDVITSPLTISVVVKAALLALLLLACAVFSFLAVGAFWWSWGTGGSVETEGWLVYGSRTIQSPHAVLPINLDRFQEDLPYDVQVELELVRPAAGAPETGVADAPGNFMVSLELRSVRNSDQVVIAASQPSLPPPPLTSGLVSLPPYPASLLPPCIIPWPFRFLCPSRVFGYVTVPNAKIKERRRKGSLIPPARGNEVVLMTKELLEGVVIRPGRGDGGIGAVFVSIGREDIGAEHREVRTTGWVVVRFVPHPTGIRWLLTSNPLPPLLILPPLSLILTVSSALLGFLVISCCTRSGYQKRAKAEKEAKEKKEKAKKSLESELQVGDKIEPFRGGAQWREFAVGRPSEGGLRTRTREDDETDLPSVPSVAESTTETSPVSDTAGSMASLTQSTVTSGRSMTETSDEWDSE